MSNESKRKNKAKAAAKHKDRIEEFVARHQKPAVKPSTRLKK